MMREIKKIDANRFSIVMAVILLAYSIAPFVKIPNRELNMQFPGFLFLLRVDYSGLVSILAAGLGATGMAWLLQSRADELRNGRDFEHLLLPALTAWAIGVPLGALEINLQWWAVFVFGGILLSAVILSEYIVIDMEDPRSGLAIIGLSAVAYVVYLILCVALRGAGIRLYLTLPVYFITAGVISWRVLKLRQHGVNRMHWSVVTALVTSQVAIGLHYLPVQPVQFGLVLTGLCYSIIVFAITYDNETRFQTSWMEAVIILTLFIGVALIVHP
jgi:hypothetical protein